MQPRYVVPSAHITVARFVDNGDFESDERVDSRKFEAWWALIDSINVRLKEDLDSRRGGDDREGQWVIEDVECRYGVNWYGGGHSWNAEGFYRR